MDTLRLDALRPATDEVPGDSERRSIAVFDLDGTITRRDTFVPYVFGLLARRPLRFLRLALVVPSLIAFLFSGNHGAVKAAVMRHALGGLRRDDLRAWNALHVPRIIERATLAGALAAIRSHRDAGDHLVLMSASPDLYIPDLARALGFDEFICTGVRWNGERLDGALATPNRRAEEKALCLMALIERDPGATITAYGNSASDLPHLRLATRGVLVNGRRVTRELAKGEGLETADWLEAD